MRLKQIEDDALLMVRRLREHAEDHSRQHEAQIDLLKRQVEELMRELSAWRAEALELREKVKA